MKPVKIIRDSLVKLLNGQKSVPEGLVEMLRYFKNNDAIVFSYHHEDGEIVAVSENFRHGSIVTSGKNEKELEANIQDAILTAFEIPSVYSNLAKVQKV